MNKKVKSKINSSKKSIDKIKYEILNEIGIIKNENLLNKNSNKKSLIKIQNRY